MTTSTRDLSSLPEIFIAYPGSATLSERMSNLADEAEDAGARVTTWQRLTNTGFLFDPIAEAIDGCGLFVAETTHGNANVMFEVGFAIARGKHVLLLRDQNVAKPVELPPLDLVRRVDYGSRTEILDFLASVDLSGPPLFEQLGVDPNHDHAGLYFVPSRRGADFNNTIMSVCRESPFVVKTMDTKDTDYDSLISQTNSILDADLFVALLVSKEVREYWHNNAEVMLFSGTGRWPDERHGSSGARTA